MAKLIRVDIAVIAIAGLLKHGQIESEANIVAVVDACEALDCKIFVSNAARLAVSERLNLDDALVVNVEHVIRLDVRGELHAS